MTNEAGTNGTYVYGVVRAGRDFRLATAGIGEPGADVTTVSLGPIAALVSAAPAGPVKANRRNVTAHSEVLREAMDASPVLPMRFGVVMPGDDAVREELLRPRYAELERLLEEFDGRVEVDLKAYYDEEAVLREIVAENREVVRLRDATRRLPEDASYFQRIRLGETVAGALQAKRDEDAREVLRRLEPLAVDVRTDPELLERLVVKAAFLVDRDRLPAFDRAVEELGARLADRMRFKYVGPLPPHSFVNLSLPVPARSAG